MSPILKPHTLEVISRWPDQTRRIGLQLGEMLQIGDVVCLVGDLGAGKTTLVQGVAQGWGSKDPVSSPTFVLINVYRHPERGELFHMDAYRLSGPAEAAELDIDHYLERGALVVEWADRIDAALPEERLLIEMQYISEQQRDLMVSAEGAHYRKMVESLRGKVIRSLVMLLAIDTSTRSMGVALYDDPQMLSEVMWVSGFYHTVELAPLVKKTMERCGASVQDLSAVAVATGPGSFTGLRIGLAFAKGLNMSLKIPVIGIPTLDIVAKTQPAGDYRLAAVLEAGRSRYAVAWYEYADECWSPVGEIGNFTLEDFVAEITEPTLVCGELDDEARKRLGRKYKNVTLASPAASVRRPGVLAELAWQRYEKDDFDDPDAISLYYLHQGEPIPG